jgi:cytochrome c oxidase subunit 3
MISDSSSDNSTMKPIDSSQEYRSDLGVMGMLLFLASLTMLFGASIIGYLVVRFRQPEWPPPNMPDLPAGLWISTIILILCSISIHFALTAIKNDHQFGLRKWISITTFLAILFLIFQTINWWLLIQIEFTANINLYAFTFFMLTGLHALHVIGGIIQLSIVMYKSFNQQYNSNYYPGILYSAMYWHFLDGIWITMFILLLILH